MAQLHLVAVSIALFSTVLPDVAHVKCANPESFVRGGPALTAFFVVDEMIQIPL